MTIDLWRLDATHDAGGAVAYFYATREAAEVASRALRGCQWKVAVRPADGLPINEAQAGWLCAGTWPNCGNEEILRLVRTAKEKASDDLRAALHRRDTLQKPFARPRR